MNIRVATAADADCLVDIWERSVLATHTFLSAAEVAALRPQVRVYLQAAPPELFVMEDPRGALHGFMGMTGPRIDSLFLAPEFQRQGGGRRLVAYALARHPELSVDVNEQNPQARRFYEACGFVVVGRSPTDDAGRPYPILHLRRAGPTEVWPESP